jgi:hypothetical protein
MFGLYPLFLVLLYSGSFFCILCVFLWIFWQDQRKQQILNFQLKIEKKLQKIKNLSFKQWLYALIGASGIQALVQYFTIEYPEAWQEKLELEFYNDPAFYLGLMLTFLIVLLIIKKYDNYKSGDFFKNQ